MPGAVSMAQQAFSTWHCAPLATPLQDPKGLVPPKWTGRPHATTLAAANRVRVRPCLAALHRVRVRPPVAVPHACARPLLSGPLAMACQVCVHSVAVHRTTLLVTAKHVHIHPVRVTLELALS